MDLNLADYALTARVSDADVLAFAEDRINLPHDKVVKYRERADSLIERLTKYIDANPDYDLEAAFHSGSLAKGTAIQGGGDLDLALYVKAGSAPQDDKGLVDWLVERLHEVLPTFSDDQLKREDHCVKLLYADHPSVDVVPVLYEGKPNWVGDLIRKRSGRRVMTSIPMHLQFIARREAQYPGYAQLVRIVKRWISLQKELDNDFRFKSFMVELICAHLCDRGMEPAEITPALQRVFGYIVSSRLDGTVIFEDYYKAAAVKVGAEPIRIYDPVNPENNITEKYTAQDRSKILQAAQKAYDAIALVPFTPTKQEAVAAWQEILGPTFRG
ncbi:MAG TPA: CBASS oligonucleotide cyclase [Candidatus Saccharimonadales bacterium]